MKLTERQTLLSALSSLKARQLDASDYGDIARLEKQGWIHLGVLTERPPHFISVRTPRPVIRDVVQGLVGEPMDTAEMRVALYELWLTTKHKKLETQDRDAMLTVYTKKLASYPADHVRIVLSDLEHSEAFFPAWADIARRLNKLSGWRAQLIAQLRRADRKIRELNQEA